MSIEKRWYIQGNEIIYHLVVKNLKSVFHIILCILYLLYSNPRPGFVHPASKLANKENDMKAPVSKKTVNPEVSQSANSNVKA